MHAELRRLLRDCEREQEDDGTQQRHGFHFTVTDRERSLLRETAYAGRTSQAAVLRRGICLAARGELAPR